MQQKNSTPRSNICKRERFIQAVMVEQSSSSTSDSWIDTSLQNEQESAIQKNCDVYAL